LAGEWTAFEDIVEDREGCLKEGELPFAGLGLLLGPVEGEAAGRRGEDADFGMKNEAID
jgi:hypothetical protein